MRVVVDSFQSSFSSSGRVRFSTVALNVLIKGTMYSVKEYVEKKRVK
jgi:hypothetical protein